MKDSVHVESRWCLRFEYHADDGLQDDSHEEPSWPSPLEDLGRPLPEDGDATGRRRSHGRAQIIDVLRLWRRSLVLGVLCVLVLIVLGLRRILVGGIGLV